MFDLPSVQIDPKLEKLLPLNADIYFIFMFALIWKSVIDGEYQ